MSITKIVEKIVEEKIQDAISNLHDLRNVDEYDQQLLHPVNHAPARLISFSNKHDELENIAIQMRFREIHCGIPCFYWVVNNFLNTRAADYTVVNWISGYGLEDMYVGVIYQRDKENNWTEYLITKVSTELEAIDDKILQENGYYKINLGELGNHASTYEMNYSEYITWYRALRLGGDLGTIYCLTGR